MLKVTRVSAHSKSDAEHVLNVEVNRPLGSFFEDKLEQGFEERSDVWEVKMMPCCEALHKVPAQLLLVQTSTRHNLNTPKVLHKIRNITLLLCHQHNCSPWVLLVCKAFLNISKCLHRQDK